MDNTFWVALSAVGTFGLFLLGMWQFIRFRRRPRVTVRSSSFDVSGLEIRNAETGRFNSMPTGDTGDTVLDADFRDKVTPIEIYASDRKTLHFRCLVDFSNGKKWVCLDYDILK